MSLEKGTTKRSHDDDEKKQARLDDEKKNTDQLESIATSTLLRHRAVYEEEVKPLRESLRLLDAAVDRPDGEIYRTQREEILRQIGLKENEYVAKFRLHCTRVSDACQQDIDRLNKEQEEADVRRAQFVKLSDEAKEKTALLIQQIDELIDNTSPEINFHEEVVRLTQQFERIKEETAARMEEYERRLNAGVPFLTEELIPSMRDVRGVPPASRLVGDLLASELEAHLP